MPEPDSEQPDEPAADALEWPPTGDEVALEPDTLPNRPLRAKDVTALIPKEIG